MDEDMLELEDDAPTLVKTHPDAKLNRPETPPRRVPITIITGMPTNLGITK